MATPERIPGHPATDPSYGKVSVTLPRDLLDRARARVGARGLSGYVAEALANEERRRARLGFLAWSDERYGPVDGAALEEVRRQWPVAAPER